MHGLPLQQITQELCKGEIIEKICPQSWKAQNPTGAKTVMKNCIAI